MRRLLPIIQIIFILLLTGCGDQRILEDIGYILQVGIESSGEDSLMVTYTYPEIGAELKNKAGILVQEGKLLREAREKGRRTAFQNLESGKLLQLLFSEELSKKGIFPYIELYERDPINPKQAFIVVVEGSPRKLMEKTLEFKDKPRPAIYINKLLTSNVKYCYIPDTRIYNFDICYYALGVDSVTPMIKIEPDGVRITGSAVFSGDKMTGKINPSQTSLLLAMMNKLKSAEYIFTAKDLPAGESSKKRGVAVTLKSGKSRIKIDMKNSKPEVEISLKMKGILNEYKWDEINEVEIQNKIEEELTRELNEECNKLIDYLQDVKSDPLGIGEIIRARYSSYWKSVDWKEAYSSLDIKVKAELDITQFGITD